MARELKDDFVSFEGLGEIVMKIPLPVIISLDLLRSMTYSETPNRIWGERRSSKHEKVYFPKTSSDSVTCERYSRRMNQGARD